MKPVTITIAQFCRLYNVGKTKTFQLLETGALERWKVGRRTLITTRSIDRFFGEQNAGDTN